MFFSILLCLSVNALIPFCSAYVSQETRYECGLHGKFEYCIDGIPGCVIGCHCHPGYYFDTESKICEPNIKLTQVLRRHYIDEPTRAYGPPAYTSTVTDIIPTPTATNNFDNKIDEFANDTDDLGDWLYNQFFKTIENQVINNSNSTNTDIKGERPTRRSGSNSKPIYNKPKRKSRIFMRSGKKKKQKKGHGLRRKLLRITEDDSLFDSESDSDTSDGSSDSDSSGDTSDTSDTSDGKKSPEDRGQDHGHKKVIIFNRRPKPPLPSFIFLPNMDTPYYPPIGLPPPPAMPMYPMVPVPPMAPPMVPMFPFQVPPKCHGDANSTTAATTTTISSTVTPAETTTDKVTTTETITPDVNTTATDIPPKTDRRSRLSKNGNKRSGKNVARASEPGKLKKLKQEQRNKLMQQLRHNIKEKKRAKIPSGDEDTGNDNPENDFPDQESLFMDDIPFSPQVPIPTNKFAQRSTARNIPSLDDVDFRYLSELIHRVNMSDIASKLPPLPFDLNDDLKALEKIKAQQTRRNFNAYNVELGNVQLENNLHRNLHKEKSDDAYYTNLGRKIASLIRSADSKVEDQINKDAEHGNRQVPFHSVLTQNNYAPRSFWERSIRSPLSQIGVFTNYLDESRTLKHGNEKDLLNLENEVEIYASTQRPLSLQDLENILNTMQIAHDHIKYKVPIKDTNESNVNLNINLLPKYVRVDNTKRRILNAPNDVNYVTEHYLSLPPKGFKVIKPTNTTNKNVDVPFNNYWMYHNNQNLRSAFATQTNISLIRNDQKHNQSTTRPPFTAVMQSPNTHAKNSQYLQFLRSMPVVKHTTPKRQDPKFISGPPEFNYKSLNYFSDIGDGHYRIEEASYPLHIVPFRRQIKKPFGRAMNPSYFHHKLHHFDYFD